MKTKAHKTTILLSLGMLMMLMVAPAAMAQADTEPPTDVENIRATAQNGAVMLSWNVAKDNDIVAGYKIYYGKKAVTEPGQDYESEIDAGNKITYTVEGLENGTPYYFAITAYDATGNESENYSVEVSVTPMSTMQDMISPTVTKAEAIDKYTVVVTFSEAVKLPATDPQSAFYVVDDATSLPLDILAAAVNLQDTTGKSVLLTTASQKTGANYVLTAGILVTDSAGNPVQSGTSDTAVFTGTALEPKVIAPEGQLLAAAEDTTGPSLIDVQVPDSTHIKIAFSEVVKLGPTPTASFIITEEADSQKLLNVLSAELSEEGDVVTLTTAPQQPVNYNLIVMEDVTDEAGNMIDVANNATVFFGGAPAKEVVEETPEVVESPLTDVTPPEDATNLQAKLLENMLAMLTWTPSLNTAGDLANYILYRSTDGTVYGEGIILNPTDNSYDLKGLVSDVTYFFKLTAKDAAGNESNGVTTAFKLELPKTGPELALLLLGSAGLGRLFIGKKKNKK